MLSRLRLFHFTDTRNIASIKKHGGIYSFELCEQKGIEIIAGGDEASQRSDQANGMHQYVHLCLLGKHPMEFRAKEQGRIETSVFLPITGEALELADVRFVPGMSNTRGIPTYPLDEAVRDNHLTAADLDALYEWTDWSVAENYARRERAEKFEIIVRDFIPIDLIKSLPHG